ncbi:hypothetical protein BIV57_07145 [Mangrovactinospora gilvigrisea]|uniref:DUF6891 domain-containing protein n=1 Tax=Mangrovactinospora gilvigrisea TaxID=1428644 RepID=A0A1J7BHN9_9ACTN|nr:hypothetical protein [Mangrovactinospora gilvigrisea]OIV38211.1 hypothetical protein BIV57_07145 [Mangrovactinospora gilvigrisea]
MSLDAQTHALLTAVARRSAAETDGSAYDILEAVGEFAQERGIPASAAEMEHLADAAAVEHTAARFVAEGYAAFDEVCEDVTTTMAEEEQITLAPATVQAIVAAAWDARLQEQRTWPDVTDNDRLARAFDDLEASGIVAREDFTCCAQCAANEIDDEIRPGSAPEGYVYFHNQDTQRAVEGGPLLLGFGSFVAAGHPDYPALSRTVGTRVMAALSAHGLTADWDGDPGRRIAVTLAWRKRLP